MYKRTTAFLLGLMLLVVFLQGTQPVRADSATEKLKISVLGDSISTFLNYSNGTAADTTNSTIRNGRKWYPYGNVTSADMTWWAKTAQLLDAEILVNNSWSGSCMYYTRADTVGAYVDRCIQLHDDTGENAGEEPDIIAVYLGTNDIGAYSNDPGSYEAIDFAKLIAEENGSVTYAQPQNVVEAYAIALDKISRRYPDAEVYCFTLLHNVSTVTRLESYNASIKKLAAHFDMHVVDLYNCGITGTSDGTLIDGIHPSVKGMTLIANAFAEAVRENMHTYTATVTAPTCTEKGYITYTCACGKSYVADYVDATGHTEVIDKAVDATCTESGLTEGKHCSVCGEILVKQQVVMAKGHTPVTDKAVAATCTEDGLTEGKHCSVCGEVLVKQQTVKAKGHTPVIDKAVAATCTESGLTEGKQCSVCGEVLVKQEVIAAKGHRFTNYISDANATIAADGTKTAKCDHGCGSSDTVTDSGSRLPAVLTSKKYIVIGSWISEVGANTTAFDFLTNVDQSNIQLEKDGIPLSNASPVGTGTQAHLALDGKVYKKWTIIVRGDINGDANVSITDMLAMKAHILKKETLTDAMAKAADVNSDGVVSITDFIQIKAHILGKQPLSE